VRFLVLQNRGDLQKYLFSVWFCVFENKESNIRNSRSAYIGTTTLSVIFIIRTKFLFCIGPASDLWDAGEPFQDQNHTSGKLRNVCVLRWMRNFGTFATFRTAFTKFSRNYVLRNAYPLNLESISISLQWKK
jgi:hypothetical protein